MATRGEETRVHSMDFELGGSAVPSESEPDQGSEEAICRICWQCETAEPGGHISYPCVCTTGVHDRCLLQWLLSETGREALDACELCVQRWEGDVTVSIQDLVEQAAALKRAQPGGAELASAVATLRQRDEQLTALLQTAAEAEEARCLDFERMRRVAAADRRAILGRLEEERCWRRSNLRWLPQLLLAVAGAFLAGWHRGGASAKAA